MHGEYFGRGLAQRTYVTRIETQPFPFDTGACVLEQLEGYVVPPGLDTYLGEDPIGLGFELLQTLLIE